MKEREHLRGSFGRDVDFFKSVLMWLVDCTDEEFITCKSDMFFRYSSIRILRWYSFCARRLCVAIYLIKIFVIKNSVKSAVDFFIQMAIDGVPRRSVDL